MKSSINKIFTGFLGAGLMLTTSCVGDLDLEPNDPNIVLGNALTEADYQNVLAKGGCVVGVQYDENMEVVYGIAENEKECEALRHSK